MPMTDEEIIQRARLAYAEVYPGGAPYILAGEWDDDLIVRTAVFALRNLDKPLPVDPDEEELREIAKALVSYASPLTIERALPTYKAIKAKRSKSHA